MAARRRGAAMSTTSQHASSVSASNKVSAIVKNQVAPVVAAAAS